MTSRMLGALGLLVLLGGCETAGNPVLDPQNRAGAWRPSGANEQNLRAMLARPTDLARGVGEPGGEGQTATQAIDRLRNDRVRSLPDSGVARLVTSSSGTTSQ